jgi:hypothetical protein
MVIKQINFNQLTGKLILSDDMDNHYFCDIYGNQLKKFLPGITGSPNNSTKRKDLFDISEGRDNRSNIYAPANFKNKNNFLPYLPITNKFEGYSKFPQPLSSPFFNLGKNEISQDNRKKLIKTLKKHFFNKKVISQFEFLEKKIENNHLSYMMVPINFDRREEDKECLISLIDEHFDNFRKENRFNADQIFKDPMMKALKRFRQLLVDNKNLSVEKKMGLGKANEIIHEKYKIIRTLNKLTEKQKENFKKNLNLNLNSKKHKENDYNISRFNPEYFSNQRGNENNLFKTHVDFNKIPNDSQKFSYQIDHSQDIPIDNSAYDNDLSHLSKNSEDDKKLLEENILVYNLYKPENLKTKEFLKKSLEIEKSFKDGFKETPIKKEGIIQKNLKTRFKTESEYFAENINILKKGKIKLYDYIHYYIVNPMIFEFMKKKEEYEYKELEKKRKQKFIFQKNLGY